MKTTIYCKSPGCRHSEQIEIGKLASRLNTRCPWCHAIFVTPRQLDQALLEWVRIKTDTPYDPYSRGE